MKNSHGYKADAEIVACMSNNTHEYRDKGLPVPAEPEVRVIVQSAVERLQGLYSQQYETELDDSPKKFVSSWLDTQRVPEEMYDAFRELEKLYDISQIVSVLLELAPVGRIGLKVMAVKPNLVVKFRYMASK